MNAVLMGFGAVYLIGAILLVLDVTPMPTLKDLSVLAFLLPGVIALVSHLEIARLRKQAGLPSGGAGPPGSKAAD